MNAPNRDQLYESVFGTLTEHGVTNPNIATDTLAWNIVDRLPVTEHPSDPPVNPQEVADGQPKAGGDVHADGHDTRPGGTGDGQPVNEAQAQGQTVPNVGNAGGEQVNPVAPA